MRIIIIIISAIFCFFLHRFLSLYISTATYIWIIILLYFKPKEDTHEYKEFKIYESDTFEAQEARIEKTRIASQKRKARKLTK